MKNYNFLFILCGLVSINCEKSDLKSSKEDLKRCLIQAGISSENPSIDTDIIMSQDFITSIEYFYNKYNSQKYVKPEDDERRFTQVDNENKKTVTDTHTPEKDGIHRDLKEILKVSNDIREISNESKIENKNIIIVKEKQSKNKKNIKEKNKDKRDSNGKKCKKNKEGKNKIEDQEKENEQFEERQEKITHTKKDKRDKLIKKLSKEICGFLDSNKLEELFKLENSEKPFKVCTSRLQKCSAKFLTGNELYLTENTEK